MLIIYSLTSPTISNISISSMGPFSCGPLQQDIQIESPEYYLLIVKMYGFYSLAFTLKFTFK